MARDVVIKALSLSRPWTTLILAGHKNIENRTWSTKYLGPLIIHGAQSWDGDNAAALAVSILTGTQLAGIPPLDYDAGNDHPLGYLGVVDLIRVCNGECFSCGPWAFKGCHHWKFTDPRPFPAPIPGAGRLGLFVPSDEALAAVEQLGANA